VRKAIAMIKRRTGPHEKFIRELDLAEHGLRLGEPLIEFQGILSGELTFTGARERLLHGIGEGHLAARQ
jgi:circadian clock protein KaiC